MHFYTILYYYNWQEALLLLNYFVMIFAKKCLWKIIQTAALTWFSLDTVKTYFNLGSASDKK